jgi:hypothetical protein
VLRCASPASKDLQYNLSVTVVDLHSNTVPYNYRDIMSSPSFLSVSPLSGPPTGGTLVRLVGKNFKDRGVVRMTSSFASYVCVTPPIGTEGNSSGVFYGKDGKLIQVLADFTLVLSLFRVSFCSFTVYGPGGCWCGVFVLCGGQ